MFKCVGCFNQIVLEAGQRCGERTQSIGMNI